MPASDLQRSEPALAMSALGQKRTCGEAGVMSALGHKQTSILATVAVDHIQIRLTCA